MTTKTNDLISKYQKDLKEKLGNNWNMYSVDNYRNEVVITYTYSYVKSKAADMRQKITFYLKRLNPNYEEPIEVCHHEQLIASIDLKDKDYYFSSEIDKYPVKTKSFLLELIDNFIEEHEIPITPVDDSLDMWISNDENVMVCYTLNNFKKENDNLVSFDVLCDEKPILEHVEWNGKSLKTLKVILLDKLTNDSNKDTNTIKNALLFCKVMNNKHFYLRVKSVAQKVLNEECYYQYL